ncbi:flagellar export protein FliJ [Desulfosalsimonas propionicica]|jgi:flagellar export protein FliJ|uniref:Flagellar FliJ protein n=1 Tax=Desulfosalsimonas propionicica TaxID=332175 RepID=A0A7W0HKP9_9BACT|nr:flagellar export protein FliJ [Desulfosalsimonas propionicica]MBA2881301.1 flagellar export protein FliJ [Desulfosalsimonas propionicica]
MKSFKLQSLLDYRKRLSDQAHQAVVVAMEHKNAVAEARRQAEKERQRLCLELESAKAGHFRMEEVLLYQQCICAKQDQLRRLEEKQARAEAAVAEKQQKLVKARQKKRILEKLRQKRSDAEEKNQARQERLITDEVAILGFGGGK